VGGEEWVVRVVDLSHSSGKKFLGIALAFVREIGTSCTMAV